MREVFQEDPKDPGSITNLIRKLMHRDPRKRPSAKDALAEWFPEHSAEQKKAEKAPAEPADADSVEQTSSDQSTTDESSPHGSDESAQTKTSSRGSDESAERGPSEGSSVSEVSLQPSSGTVDGGPRSDGSNVAGITASLSSMTLTATVAQRPGL